MRPATNRRPSAQMANSARGQEMAKRNESESVRVDAPPTVSVGVSFAPRACRFDRGGAATSGSLAIGPATGLADFTVTIGISQRGSAIESSGMTSALTSASVQMKWRSAADARRNVYAATPATPSTTVAFTTLSNSSIQPDGISEIVIAMLPSGAPGRSCGPACPAHDPTGAWKNRRGARR